MNDSKPTLNETVAEAERRFPYWNTPGADRDRHRSGYWAFIAGAGWARKTDAAAEPAGEGI